MAWDERAFGGWTKLGTWADRAFDGWTTPAYAGPRTSFVRIRALWLSVEVEYPRFVRAAVTGGTRVELEERHE